MFSFVLPLVLLTGFSDVFAFTPSNVSPTSPMMRTSTSPCTSTTPTRLEGLLPFQFFSRQPPPPQSLLQQFSALTLDKQATVLGGLLGPFVGLLGLTMAASIVGDTKADRQLRLEDRKMLQIQEADRIEDRKIGYANPWERNELIKTSVKEAKRREDQAKIDLLLQTNFDLKQAWSVHQKATAKCQKAQIRKIKVDAQLHTAKAIWTNISDDDITAKKKALMKKDLLQLNANSAKKILDSTSMQAKEAEDIYNGILKKVLLASA